MALADLALAFADRGCCAHLVCSLLHDPGNRLAVFLRRRYADSHELGLELVLHDHRMTAYDPVVGLNRVDLLDQDGAAYHFMIHRSTKCLTRYEYTLVVEELPRDTEWLELQVEGSDFAMRVGLRKGVQE